MIKCTNIKNLVAWLNKNIKIGWQKEQIKTKN